MTDGPTNALRAEDIEAALVRAAARARRIAAETGTPLVVVRDGKVVHLPVGRHEAADETTPERRP